MTSATETRTYEYTPREAAGIATVNDWLKQHDKTRAWLARLTRISSATISQILNGKYPAPCAEQLKSMTDALATYNAQAELSDSRTVPTSITKLLATVCNRSRKHASFGMLTGSVGIGKTEAAKLYQAHNKHTVLLEANPDMTPGVLLRELLAALDAAQPRGLDAKFQALVEAVKGTTALIILDEAETVQPRCLHYLRRLRDKAGIGIVLIGTKRLNDLIGAHGVFDQIGSRVATRPHPIRTITEDDAGEMARAHLAPAEVNDTVLATLWAYCGGSARMLCENLIGALRDYGIGQGKPLSEQLVHQVAQKVLFLPAAAKARA